MLNKEIPSLISVSQELQAKQSEIINYWITTETVVNVLAKHSIDIDVFKNDYAEKILDYYFGVVNQEKEIGDCPVMAEFLQMLKEHDISADELFDICTHARKSMVSVAFDLGIISKELFRDISYVFDLNFKGVLHQYSNTVYRLEKEVEAHIQESKQKDLVMFHQARLAQMGEMISNIAHQWRQPISMISSIIQNLQMKKMLEKLEDDFFDKSTQDIKKIINQMSATITDFQNFFEPNKAKKDFSIQESVTRALELVQQDLKRSSVKVSRHHEDSEGNVFGYPNEFSQIILNILFNAKDALVENNEHDNREIYIKTVQEEKSVSLTISDNGGGIPEDVIDKIFNPYFTTKEEGKGTGIGLYMSTQIIKNMSGTIEAKNVNLDSNSKGASFTIKLPLL